MFDVVVKFADYPLWLRIFALLWFAQSVVLAGCLLFVKPSKAAGIATNEVKIDQSAATHGENSPVVQTSGANSPVTINIGYTVGADLEGKSGAAFELIQNLIYTTTLTSAEKISLEKLFLQKKSFLGP